MKNTDILSTKEGGQLESQNLTKKTIDQSVLSRLRKNSLKIMNTFRSLIQEAKILIKQRLHFLSKKSVNQEKTKILQNLKRSLSKMVSVKYSGPMIEMSGYAQANRNIVKALCDVGVDVVTEIQIYANQNTDYGDQCELAKSLQNKHNGYPIKVLHITPNVYAKHKEVGKYHIGHLFWETTGMSDVWAWYLHEVREIWTGCEWNVECFRNSGFEGKIFKFPQPINVDRNEEAVPIENAQGFVFYSIFQWIERKDPQTLLEAYWREFENEENVTLVIKTHGTGIDQEGLSRDRKKIILEISELKKKLNLQKTPRTLLLVNSDGDIFTDKQLHQFHASADCFVSAHRGEGWGIPQCEAMVHGKPVISTGLGGIHEWVPENSMFKVKYSLVPVEDSQMRWAEQYHGNKQKWGQADINDLREKMRFVFNNRQEAAEVGKRGQKYAKDNLNFKVVGEQMKKRIQEIYHERNFK